MALKEGLRSEIMVEVSRDMAIDFLGNEGAVLSTPSMINLMEHTCRIMIKPYLSNEEESLGTMINAKHLAPTPVGMKVTIKATLINVNGRRVTFSIEAYDEKEKIGEALHERVIVNKNRFIARLRKR